jgi:hypothetical protein
MFRRDRDRRPRAGPAPRHGGMLSFQPGTWGMRGGVVAGQAAAGSRVVHDWDSRRENLRARPEIAGPAADAEPGETTLVRRHT